MEATKPETLADLASEAKHLAVAIADLRDRLRAMGADSLECRSEIASGHLNAAWLLTDCAAQAIDLMLPTEPAVLTTVGKLAAMQQGEITPAECRASGKVIPW